MSPRRAKTRVDPELRRQLSRAATARTEPAAPVEAVLRLRPATRRGPAPSGGEARDLAAVVVARVAEELGVSPGDYDVNVFENLGYFVLAAPPGFVERVLDQPEVASASANRRRG
jgi:hypothetical protein